MWLATKIQIRWTIVKKDPPLFRLLLFVTKAWETTTVVFALSLKLLEKICVFHKRMILCTSATTFIAFLKPCIDAHTKHLTIYILCLTSNPFEGNLKRPMTHWPRQIHITHLYRNYYINSNTVYVNTLWISRTFATLHTISTPFEYPFEYPKCIKALINAFIHSTCIMHNALLLRTSKFTFSRLAQNKVQNHTWLFYIVLQEDRHKKNIIQPKYCDITIAENET